MIKKLWIISGIIWSCFAQANPFHAVSAELDPNGTYYRVGNLTPARETLWKFSKSVSSSIMKSTLSADAKAECGFYFDLFEALIRLSGMDAVVGTGASSIVLASPDRNREVPLFHNKFCYLHAPGRAEGLIWHIFGPVEEDLMSSLEAWPGSALAVFSGSLNLKDVYQSLDHAKLISEENKALLTTAGVSGIDKLLESVSGPVGAALFEPTSPGTPFAFMVAIHDRDGRLFDLAVKLLSPVPGAVLEPKEKDNEKKSDATPVKLSLPPLAFGEGQITPYIVRSGKQLLIYSDPKVHELLKSNDRVSSHVKRSQLDLRMPRRALGFVYTSKKFWKYATDSEFTNFKSEAPFPALLEADQLWVFGRCRDGLKVWWNAPIDGNMIDLVLKGSLPATLGILAALPTFERARAETDRAACVGHCRAIGEALKAYAAKNDGNYPKGDDVAGLRELVTGKFIAADKFRCPAACDTPVAKEGEFGDENCSYIYFSGMSKQNHPDLPVVFDWPLNHEDQVNVLFSDGRVESFKIENAASCKRIISYLHTRFQYSEELFKELLRKAERFDKQYELE